jgi:uncharacterized membrane protein
MDAMPSKETQKKSFLSWIPLVGLSVAAIYLAARFNELPERWVSHWDAFGRPNGWTTRTVPGVFGLSCVALVIWAVAEITIGVILTRGEPELAPVRAASARMLRLIVLATSLLFAALSLTLPFALVRPGAVLLFSVALLPVPMVMGARGVNRALREVRARGHGEKVTGYHGVFYSNPDDRRLWVPKLSGIGATINFAHPRAWPMMALLVGAPLLLALGSAIVFGPH